MTLPELLAELEGIACFYGKDAAKVIRLAIAEIRELEKENRELKMQLEKE